MVTRQDAKSKVDKIQAKLDRREGERDAGLKRADQEHSAALAAAKRQQTASKDKTKEELDPIIADLKKQLKDAKRDTVPPQMRPDRKFGLRSFEE